MSVAAAREKLLRLREEAIVRALRERPPPQLVAIDTVLAALDEEPTEWESADRAVVSDDGRSVRLVLFAETGTVGAVDLDPLRAIALAGELIARATSRLAERYGHTRRWQLAGKALQGDQAQGRGAERASSRS
jgi:hypothetical protein